MTALVDRTDKIMELTEGEGADAVFLTALDPSLAEAAVALTRKTGRMRPSRRP